MIRTRLLLALLCAMTLAPAGASGGTPCPGAATCPWSATSTYPAAVTGLKEATDVAVDPTDGDVYVTEREFNRVVRYVDGNAANREVWGERNGSGAGGHGPGEFEMPEGVAVDAAGDVWVAEINGNRVQKFTESGELLLTLGGNQGDADGEFVFPNDVAVGAGGTVYVADGGNQRIQAFDAQGNFLWKTSGTGDSAFGWNGPQGIAFQDSLADVDYVWATDGDKVKRFNAQTGAWVATDDGLEGDGGLFNDLRSIAVIGADVYVADVNKIYKLADGGPAWTGHEVSPVAQLTGIDAAFVDGVPYVFASNANHPHVDRLTTAFDVHDELFTSPSGQLYDPIGTTVDADGNVWVLEESYSRLVKFTSAGAYVAQFGADGGSGASGSGAGEFNYPRDVAASGNTIFVADTSNGRIQKYDGTSWTTLTPPASGFVHPFGVTVSGSSVYVADADTGKVWKSSSLTPAEGDWQDLGLPPITGGFLQDVATDGTDVYVSTSADPSQIRKLPSGGSWTTIAGEGTGDGQVDSPRSIALAGSHLFVADTNNNRIQKLTTSGAFVSKWGSGDYPPLCDGEVNSPYGIATDAAGESVFVANSIGQFAVRKFVLTGPGHTPDCDTASPPVHIGTPAHNATEVGATPSFSGSKGNDATDEDQVTVRILKRTGAGLAVVRKLTSAVQDADAWSVTWSGDPLPNGEYWAIASQRDAAGNTGHSNVDSANWGAQRFTVGAPVDTTAPVVNLSAPLDNSHTNQRRPAISGTGGNQATDSSIYFELNKLNGSTWQLHHDWTIPRPSPGTSFSTTVPIDLADGTYHLRAYQSDDAGNHNPQDQRTSRLFVVDTVAPVVDLTSPADNSTTQSKRPAISGSAGSQTSDGELRFELNRWTGSAWVHERSWTHPKPSSGQFSTEVPVDLSPATYHLRAYQSDAAGNNNPQDPRSSRQFTVEPFSNPPVLAFGGPGHLSSTNQAQPTIWGTSDTPGQVRLDLHQWNGATWVFYASYYANVSGGYWQVKPPSAFPEGAYSPIVYQTNMAGQTNHATNGWFFVDRTAPAKPRITSPADNTKVGTQTPTFSGTADPNAGTDKVYLQLQGYQNGKWVVLKTETIQRSGGTWTFKPTEWKFTEGYFTAFAYQADAAGNVAYSDGSQFQVDLNAKAPDNPGTSNDECQKTLDYGPFHVEGTCLKREGLTWVSTASLTFNGLQLQPDGGGAKVILDPFNLRIAAKGNVKVVLGPKHLCLADPTRIISDTCFYSYTVGPFVLYKGEFDWSWQGKVQLPELPKFGLPAWGGVSLPQLPGLSGFNLPNLQIPDWGAVALPDFSKIKGPQIGTLSLPSLNAPNITLPDKYFGNFKFDLPTLSIGTSGATNIFGFPIEGRLGLQFVDQGIRIDAGLKLPSLLGGVVGDAKLFVGNSGNLLAENLHMGVGGASMGPIGFRDLTIDYSAANQLWEGGAWIDLPVPPDGLAVRAGAGFQNGQLVNAEAGFEKNFPIGTSGLFLYGGSIYFKTVPRRIVGGKIALGLGPSIKGASAVRVDTDIQYKFADPGYQSSFRFDGGVKVVSIPLASAYVEIYEEGSIDFGGKFGKDFGNGFKAEAYVDGWINGPKKKFNVYGNGQVKLGDWFKFDGEVNVSHIGVGGCAAIDSWGRQVKFGATYIWSTGAFNPMWSSCSISAVKAKKATARVAGARQTVTVPGGEEAYVLGFKGRTGAPEVTLTGPKGERVSTAGQSGVVNKNFLVVHIPEQNLTQVVLHEPAGGAWTVEVDDASTPVDQVLTAESIPTPRVTAKVTGKGYNRTLEYDTSAVQDGQRVTFVEGGPKGADHVLGEVGSGKGRLRFTPMAGPGGVRPIKAIVTQGGVMRFNLEKVASYRATKPGVPPAPRNVVAKRKKGKRADTVRTTWTKVAGASEYRVTVMLNGRRRVYETRKTRLKVPGLFDRSSARISVAGVNVLGQVGKAKKAKVAAPKAKHPPKRKKRK